ncbi:MAG: hypothetical protein FWB76_05960 [Oscillospiraceae bacterium]|nr:hypothetical protein [Oscillospiraceae bacterium]
MSLENSTNSIHLTSIAPTAQRSLFNTRFTLRLPGSWQGPVMLIFLPFTLMITLVQNVVIGVGTLFGHIGGAISYFFWIIVNAFRDFTGF